MIFSRNLFPSFASHLKVLYNHEFCYNEIQKLFIKDNFYRVVKSLHRSVKNNLIISFNTDIKVLILSLKQFRVFIIRVELIKTSCGFICLWMLILAETYMGSWKKWVRLVTWLPVFMLAVSWRRWNIYIFVELFIETWNLKI